MLERSVALGIVAAGQTLVILGASLDLSVAYVISLTSIVGAETMNGDSGRVMLGIGAALLVGATVGLVNGLVITKLRVNAFIATLGTALIVKGIIESKWDGPTGSVPDDFESTLGFTRFGPIPLSVILLALVVAAVWFLLRFTRFGHRLYAVGGSEEVAKLSGVQTHRVLISAHVLCSLAAAITGLFLASPPGLGQPARRHRRRLRPRVDRRRGARRHGPGRAVAAACSGRWRASSSSRCSTAPSTSSRSMPSPRTWCAA